MDPKRPLRWLPFTNTECAVAVDSRPTLNRAQMSTRLILGALLASVIGLGLPIAFLLGMPLIPVLEGSFSWTYRGLIPYIGESAARRVFGVAWLLIDALLIWRFFFSRRPITPDPEGWPNE